MTRTSMSDSGTVFVVDDDASVRSALGRLLRSAGYSVELFGDAEALLARGRPDGPACAVLDLSLPTQGGLEIQQCLASAAFPLSVLFLTGHGDIRSSVLAMKSGAIDFLTKPVNDTELLSAIQRALTDDVARCTKKAKVNSIAERANL